MRYCVCVRVFGSRATVRLIRRHSLGPWIGEVAAVPPEASITIHYYSALSVCKCFLTTRDSRPSSLPTSPICGGRRARADCKCQTGKESTPQEYQISPFNLTGLSECHFTVLSEELFSLPAAFGNQKNTHFLYKYIFSGVT